MRRTLYTNFHQNRTINVELSDTNPWKHCQLYAETKKKIIKWIPWPFHQAALTGKKFHLTPKYRYHCDDSYETRTVQRHYVCISYNGLHSTRPSNVERADKFTAHFHEVWLSLNQFSRKSRWLLYSTQHITELIDYQLHATGKAIPLQAWTDPEGSRRFRLTHFRTFSTWRW